MKRREGRSGPPFRFTPSLPKGQARSPLRSDQTSRSLSASAAWAAARRAIGTRNGEQLT